MGRAWCRGGRGVGEGVVMGRGGEGKIRRGGGHLVRDAHGKVVHDTPGRGCD